MSIHHSTKVVTDGLVMYYDMPNGKSFVGAPITNTLDTASINGYPTYGNGWGTYNTNQYNSAQYFSIGTIASVSGNLVTTAAAHPLFSYSVVTPQSSGGGLTAGTNYLIKKVSSTSFTIHAHNASQDGSQGYINPATGTHKVYDDFANDVRVAVNATSFPTMWWGPPHVPNSCLVKEIIPRGFNGILGRTATDCIRLHWIQPDGIVDGMAYGPNGAVVAGQAYTVSFWTRSVTPNAVGQNLGYSIYNHGSLAAAGYGYTATLGPVGVWTKHSMTFTPINVNCISYWFPSVGNMKVDLANIQFEAGSIANNFVNGTRTNTQAVLDLTGNNTLTASSLTYASDGTFSFNGSSNSITIPFNSSLFTFNSEQTIILWMKNQSPSSARRNPYNQAYAGGGTITHENDTNFNYFWGQGGGDNNPYEGFTSGFSVVVGETAMVCLTRNASTVSYYKNGAFSNSTSNPYGSAVVTGTNNITIGQGYAGNFSGGIYTVQLYNRCLSAAEVAQNFNALRRRYSL